VINISISFIMMMMMMMMTVMMMMIIINIIIIIITEVLLYIYLPRLNRILNSVSELISWKNIVGIVLIFAQLSDWTWNFP